jgi:hypothetical protein
MNQLRGHLTNSVVTSRAADVLLLLRAAKLGLSVKLKNMPIYDEANALEVIGKKRSILVKNVVALLSVVGVTQHALRKSNQGNHHGIPVET